MSIYKESVVASSKVCDSQASLAIRYLDRIHIETGL